MIAVQPIVCIVELSLARLGLQMSSGREVLLEGVALLDLEESVVVASVATRLVIQASSIVFLNFAIVARLREHVIAMGVCKDCVRNSGLWRRTVNECV